MVFPDQQHCNEVVLRFMLILNSVDASKHFTGTLLFFEILWMVFVELLLTIELQ